MSNKYLLKIKKPIDYVPISNGNTKVPEKALCHPIPYRLRKIANQFRKFHKIESNKLNFASSIAPSNINTNTVNACNTVACHAGWAIPALINLKFEMPIVACSRKGYDGYFKDVTFTRGIISLSNYLFGNSEDSYQASYRFDWWAELYPSLFGGKNGSCMFAYNGYYAFVKDVVVTDDALGAVTLEAIADRYDDIAYRIEQKFYKK